MQMLSAWVWMLALMLSGAPAFAEDARHNDVEVKLEQSKVTQVDGKVSLVAVEKIAPGDVIQYEATYRNTTQRAVHGLKAELPIPLNTQYVTGSAQPAKVLVSTDGVNFARPPLKRKIRNASGAEEEHEIPLAEYRFLRWELGDLSGGKKVAVTARVRVD